MMIQFQTQVEYYENKIPVNIQIFITRGLFSLTTTSELSDIRANLSLKLPVILKKKSIAYSKLKIRISSTLSQRISKVIDIHKLEHPIASAISDFLSEDKEVSKTYTASRLSLSQRKTPNSNYSSTPKQKLPKANLTFACQTIRILQSQNISAMYLVTTQKLALILAQIYKKEIEPNLLIFNFYKNPESIMTLGVFLHEHTSVNHKLAFIGIENLPKTRQESLYQFIKDRISNCLFFMKPCRCGNFLNNNKQCLCHSLIRSKSLDSLSGELISALDFNISFFESNSNPGMVISDFFYTTITDQALALESINPSCLDSIQISSYLQLYIEDLYTTFNLQPSLVKSLIKFSCFLAYLRGRSELLFADIFDVINLQANWYKYAKNSEFIQHRPLL